MIVGIWELQPEPEEGEGDQEKGHNHQHQADGDEIAEEGHNCKFKIKS